MANSIFADISAFQSSVAWAAYVAWAKQWDGVARVSLKASEGAGIVDQQYHIHLAGAHAAGIGSVIHYHYARPDLGNSPQQEAEYFHATTGPIGANDFVMLDYEGYNGVTGPFTAEWALAWLQHAESLYGRSPLLYSYLSFVQGQLQDARLAAYPLVLAEYTFDSSARPACPAPWKNYIALQYSDRANIPGILGPVDVNVFLGGFPTDMINITDPFAAAHFTQVNTNPDRWHCAHTDQSLFAGILAGWRAMNGAPRLPIGPEVSCGKQAVYQECESGLVVYDPAHELDGPSGPWAPCYLLRLDSALAKQVLKIGQPAPVDTTALVAALDAIPDALAATIAPLVANAIVKAKNL